MRLRGSKGPGERIRLTQRFQKVAHLSRESGEAVSAAYELTDDSQMIRAQFDATKLLSSLEDFLQVAENRECLLPLVFCSYGPAPRQFGKTCRDFWG